jgi:hypothetical protein
MVAAGAVLLLAGIFGGVFRAAVMTRVLVGVAGALAIAYGLWMFYSPLLVVRHFQQTASEAFATCHAPTVALGTLPDGNTASKDDMMAAQKNAKAFDSQTNAYLTCLDAAAEHLRTQYSAMVTQGELAKADDERTRLHNAAIDKDEAEANGFNAQLRVFKARGSDAGSAPVLNSPPTSTSASPPTSAPAHAQP